MENLQPLKEKILLVCKILDRQGLLDGFGHVTMRLSEDRILSTPKMPPGKVSMRDFIILNMKGEKLEGSGEPNGEVPMHTSIYKARLDVKCILHYHPDELIALSIAGQEVKVVANCGAFFYRGTPIFDSSALIRTEALGDQLARALGDRNVVLLRGHGATVVADDLDEILRLGISLVKTARIQIMASSLGTYRTHSEAECKAVVDVESGERGRRRFLDYYLSETLD